LYGQPGEFQQYYWCAGEGFDRSKRPREINVMRREVKTQVFDRLPKKNVNVEAKTNERKKKFDQNQRSTHKDAEAINIPHVSKRGEQRVDA